MTTAADLEAQLEALRRARASGVRSVGFDGKTVEYRSDSELAAAIADIERRIAVLRGQRVHTIKIASSKGY